MSWQKSKTFLFFLCAITVAPGSASNKMCLQSDANQGLPEEVVVNCEDMSSSLKSIMPTFGGNVLCAADGEEYHHASHQYASPRVATTPNYIVEAKSGDDVQAAIMFSNHCDYKVTARSGGHSYMGSSSCDGSETPCIQLDVGNIAHLSVSNGQINLGPGVRLEDLYPVLIENDIYIPAGECGDIGVGGHMQTGGK
jgi:FAD/FMN-containing dehydrogenase